MLRTNAGFTIIELLIAVLLAAIVTSAAMGLYITQHKQLIVQDQVADMQTSVRAAVAELARNIRMAGYDVPPVVQSIRAYNTNPDTIIVSYNSAQLTGVLIEHAMPRPSAELRCDGHDISALRDGDWIYIYDPFSQTGEYFQATNIQYASSNIQHNTMPLSKAYPYGSQVIKIERFKFFVDQSEAAHPRLMVQYGGDQPQTYADNITGLNFSYVLSSGAVVDVPPNADMIREVIITVNARNDRTDSEFFSTYRTRSLSTRIKVRNLGVN